MPSLPRRSVRGRARCCSGVGTGRWTVCTTGSLPPRRRWYSQYLVGPGLLPTRVEMLVRLRLEGEMGLRRTV